MIVCWFLFLSAHLASASASISPFVLSQTCFTCFCLVWSYNCSKNQYKTILGPKQVRTGKKPEINKQSGAKFWFNWRKHGAFSYSLSCTKFKYSCRIFFSFFVIVLFCISKVFIILQLIFRAARRSENLGGGHIVLWWAFDSSLKNRYFSALIFQERIFWPLKIQL